MAYFYIVFIGCPGKRMIKKINFTIFLFFVVNHLVYANNSVQVHKFRVMTYNVKQIPCLEKSLEFFIWKKSFKWCPLKDDWTASRLQRREELIRFLKKQRESVHVVGIQELFWGKFNEEEIKSLAKKAGYPYVSFGPEAKVKSLFGLVLNRFNSLVSSGLVLLSKFPIVKESSKTFSQCSTTDCYAAKGIQYVQIKNPQGHYLDVFNTHAQAHSPYEMIRISQFEEMAKFIENNRSSPHVFVIGDFNTNNSIKYLRSWKKLEQFLSFNSARDCKNSNCDHKGPEVNDYLNEKSLDHIFYMSERHINVSRIFSFHPKINWKKHAFGVSDHLPFIAVFDLD